MRAEGLQVALLAAILLLVVQITMLAHEAAHDNEDRTVDACLLSESWLEGDRDGYRSMYQTLPGGAVARITFEGGYSP